MPNVGLPQWYQHQDELTPQQSEAAMAQARELALPPSLRASGRKRQLRDAYYGRMLLDQVNTPDARVFSNGLTYLGMLAHRDAARVEMDKVIAELVELVNPAGIEWCKDAAKKLYAFAMQEARRERARRG